MGWRAFTRRVIGLPQDDNCNHAWWAGDLAECIVDDDWVRARDMARANGPAHGDVNRVVEVAFLAGDVCLRFSKWPNCFYACDHFRKIVPQADRAEPADADFLKSIAPARVEEPA